MSDPIILYDADVSKFTTFGIPARAAALALWTSADDLTSIITLHNLPRPLKAIGHGSNLLITKPFGGTLLVRNGNPSVTVDTADSTVVADAGASLDRVCAVASSNGLRGLENLSGIPGTLGGALVQNAGAYGAEIGEFLIDLTAFDLESGNLKVFSREDMQYSYRSSVFKAESGRYVILSARLQLETGSAPARLDYGNLREALGPQEPTPEAVREIVLKIRAAKLPDPAEIGSAGSFFRNPEVPADMLLPEMPRYDLGEGRFKVPAAWLIDHAGLKGEAVGGASVWPSQPLVIVNTDGKATASDILALEAKIINTVRNRFNITLTPEVEHL